ncbi:MAG: hypothetical protein RLZZ507_4386 [Cyanobacteriota bacterium]|jgi:hypothetical protein
MKLLKLPSGDYINLELACTVEFGTFPDGSGVSHQRCKIFWSDNNSDVYCDNVAIFIKDYLDKNHDSLN